MEFFRRINKRILLLWVLLLSLTLLCAQGTELHIHNLDHDHLSKAHFIQDTSHGDHHHDGISEVEISPDEVLKTPNHNIFSIALFALFFTLVMFVSSRQFIQHRLKNRPIIKEYYLFSPPLRAPPQH